MIVLDASVVLASLLNEPGGGVLLSLDDETVMSAVNLGEVATKLTEQGYSDEAVFLAVAPFQANCHALTPKQAVQAGLWRRETRRMGLSMGDRCCLALGLDLGATVYTADRKWAALDLGVTVRMIR